MGNIQDIIQQLAGTQMRDNVITFDAEVLSVDMDNRTCIVTMLGGQSANEVTVRLMATVNDGMYLIPKVGSTVIVTASDYVEPYVSMYSDIEQIIWLGGEYLGVPIIAHPTDIRKGIVAKLNAIENLLNSHISKYNAHIHTGTVTATFEPLVTVAPLPAFFESTVIAPITANADISHPKITH